MAVQPGDDEATLAQRVLEREHPLLRACVGLIAAGRVALRAARIELDGAPLPLPLRLQDDSLCASRA